MGKIDIEMKNYMSNPERFADLFNFLIYGGQPIILADALTPLDTNEKAVFLREGEREPSQRFRDLVRLWSVMEDGHAVYAILGLEGQTNVDYMMAIRTMVSDAMNYWQQAKRISDRRRDAGTGYYPSAFTGEDRIIPVITLVLYLGSRPWDGAKDIHGMLTDTDAKLLEYVPNYKMNLIEPSGLSDDDLERFRTDVGDLLEFIKLSDDKEKLKARAKLFRPVDPDTVALINLITDARLKLEVKEGKVDMCRAIQELRAEERALGVEQGWDKRSIDVAQAMILDGMPTDMILKYSKLSLEQLKEQAKKMNKKLN